MSFMNLTAIFACLLTLNPREAPARISSANQNPISFDRLAQITKHNKGIIQTLQKTTSSSCLSIKKARPYYVKVIFGDGHTQYMLPVESNADRCPELKDGDFRGGTRICELKFITVNKFIAFSNTAVHKRTIHIPAPVKGGLMVWRNGGKKYVLAKQPFELLSRGGDKYPPCKLKEITAGVRY